ncbi:MAG: hypothetical protein E7575_01670 [Ruminococcaceae bacterium]|nr:hypothetical protein [Oscillospiraceae bacterium]
MDLRKLIVAISALLAVSAVFVSCAVPYSANKQQEAAFDMVVNDENAVSRLPSETEAEDTQAVEKPCTQDTADTEKTETAPPETMLPEIEPSDTTAPAPETDTPSFVPVSPDYADYDPSIFDNALFIGDSRTVGIKNNSKLGNADVFATKGLNIFRVFNETVETGSAGETKLIPLLESKKYDKVYIMLGINEIGYNIDAIKNKYNALMETVLSLQPDATVFMCANLHITHERSSRDSTYNNARLDLINAFMASFADGERVRYLDVNTVFDDSNSALGKEYAADDFHLLSQYYIQWGRWLASMT